MRKIKYKIISKIKNLLGLSHRKERRKRIKKIRYKRAEISKDGWKHRRNRVVREQYEKYGYKFCQDCGKFLRKTDISVDHIIPVFSGGKSNIENLQILCFNCQKEKSKLENKLQLKA